MNKHTTIHTLQTPKEHQAGLNWKQKMHKQNQDQAKLEAKNKLKYSRH